MSLIKIKSKLIPLRKKIDKIDKQILQLFAKRSYIIPKVTLLKKNSKYKIAFTREVAMARALRKNDKGLYKDAFIQKIWREIISATLQIENNLSIDIYKLPRNYYSLWELAKDFFGSYTNLRLIDDIEIIFQNLLDKKTDSAVMPFFKEHSWWLELLKPQYREIRINLVLPFIKDFKTLGNSKGICISLNDEDIFQDNLYYIIKKEEIKDNYEMIDEKNDYLLINTKGTFIEEGTFIGSSANEI